MEMNSLELETAQTTKLLQSLSAKTQTGFHCLMGWIASL